VVPEPLISSSKASVRVRISPVLKPELSIKSVKLLNVLLLVTLFQFPAVVRSGADSPKSIRVICCAKLIQVNAVNKKKRVVFFIINILVQLNLVITKIWHLIKLFIKFRLNEQLAD
jgi:hypothetical protein